MRVRSSRTANIHWLFLAVLLVFAAGCGRNTGKVSIGGDVSYDGQPVATGTIIFTPVEGTQGPSTGGGIEAETGEGVGVEQVSEFSRRVEGGVRSFDAEADGAGGGSGLGCSGG